MLTPKMKEEIEKFAKEKGLSKKELETLIKMAEEYAETHKVETWEAMGLVTAQSMAEPATQATLRTFHAAGSAEVSVSSGMDRILEVADALKKIKTPIMYVYLREPYNKDEKKARELARSMEEKYLVDVATIEEDLFKRTIAIRIHDMVEVVKKKVKQKVANKGEVQEDEDLLVITFKDLPLDKIRKITQSLERLHISGIRGVKRALVRKEGEEYMIMTSGTNLKAVLKMKEVDHTRTYSNNIHEVAEVLGIEAARYLIVKELFDAYMGVGLFVDPRHMALVADVMTATGKVMPIGRTGIAGRKGSVLARAAFEETNKHLVEAATWNEVDHLKGIIENLLVGLPIKAGTGRVKLVVK